LISIPFFRALRGIGGPPATVPAPMRPNTGPFARRLRHGLPLGALLLAGALGACSPIIHTDGQIPDPVKLASIQPGVQTRKEVAKLLGSPSSVTTFGDNTWYYVSRRTTQIAFLTPDVLEQRVIAINFNKKGVVRSVRQFGLDDATNISPVSRTTPTKGKQLTILDQMIGNLNRGYATKR